MDREQVIQVLDTQCLDRVQHIEISSGVIDDLFDECFPSLQRLTVHVTDENVGNFGYNAIDDITFVLVGSFQQYCLDGFFTHRRKPLHQLVFLTGVPNITVRKTVPVRCLGLRHLPRAQDAAPFVRRLSPTLKVLQTDAATLASLSREVDFPLLARLDITSGLRGNPLQLPCCSTQLTTMVLTLTKPLDLEAFVGHDFGAVTCLFVSFTLMFGENVTATNIATLQEAFPNITELNIRYRSTCPSIISLEAFRLLRKLRLYVQPNSEENSTHFVLAPQVEVVDATLGTNSDCHLYVYTPAAKCQYKRDNFNKITFVK